jgi:hypothetical protein
MLGKPIGGRKSLFCFTWRASPRRVLPDGAPSPCWLAPPPTCWHARLTAGTALSLLGLGRYAAGAGA